MEGSTNYTYVDTHVNQESDDALLGLWIVSISLALGLIFGFALVQSFSAISPLCTQVFRALFCLCTGPRNNASKLLHDPYEHTLDQLRQRQEEDSARKRERSRQQEVTRVDPDDDPDEKTWRRQR